MKISHQYAPRHHYERENLDVYINRKLILTIKNIQKMATISIDIEDNEADLQTLVANFQTAYAALQNATLSNLTQTLADLTTASDALAAFQISFTASVPPSA